MQTRSGQWGITLAAVAMLGLLAPQPLQAQSSRMQTTQQLLATLNLTPVGTGISYGQLGSFDLFIMAGRSSSRPACLIFVKSEREKAADVGAAATRFLQVYKLQGYKSIRAKNGNAVMLTDDRQRSSSWYSRGEQAAEAFSQEKSPAPLIEWLNVARGCAFHRCREGTLYWRGRVRVGNGARDIEVALDLLQSAPLCVDLRVRGITQNAMPEMVDGNFNLNFTEDVSGTRISALRRKIGSRPLAVAEDGDLEDCICLVRVEGEAHHYRLGDYDALVRIREQRKGEEEKTSLPEVVPSTWADEIKEVRPFERPATPEKPAEPAPAQTQTPQHQESVPKSEPKEEPAMPTPAEARESFIQRLKAL